MKLHSKDLGTLGETRVMTQLMENNVSVFNEFGDNSKIDLIAETTDGRLHRIQVKAYNRDKRQPDTTILSFKKSGPNYKFKYDDTMFDWFAVVDVKTNNIAWVPSKLANGHSTLSLRHDDKKYKTAHYFKDYGFPF